MRRKSLAAFAAALLALPFQALPAQGQDRPVSYADTFAIGANGLCEASTFVGLFTQLGMNTQIELQCNVPLDVGILGFFVLPEDANVNTALGISRCKGREIPLEDQRVVRREAGFAFVNQIPLCEDSRS